MQWARLLRRLWMNFNKIFTVCRPWNKKYLLGAAGCIMFNVVHLCGLTFVRVSVRLSVRPSLTFFSTISVVFIDGFSPNLSVVHLEAKMHSLHFGVKRSKVKVIGRKHTFYTSSSEIIRIWIRELLFSFYSTMEMTCLYAAELTTVGNLAMTRHVLQWGKPPDIGKSKYRMTADISMYGQHWLRFALSECLLVQYATTFTAVSRNHWTAVMCDEQVSYTDQHTEFLASGLDDCLRYTPALSLIVVVVVLTVMEIMNVKIFKYRSALKYN